MTVRDIVASEIEVRDPNRTSALEISE